MEVKYSKTQFDGYTHRFIVHFITNDMYSADIHIYSNSGNRSELEWFIDVNKSDKVSSYRISYVCTKEQDDKANEFINEFFDGTN